MFLAAIYNIIQRLCPSVCAEPVQTGSVLMVSQIETALHVRYRPVEYDMPVTVMQD